MRKVLQRMEDSPILPSSLQEHQYTLPFSEEIPQILSAYRAVTNTN
jgi:hypothetical protein